ncbi:hypothetical protein PF005_g26558 [Phytophthora fragariae]|uniref:Uncharacterized protein n=1 Tax=Phytophthora fragariae TaxID=53985 RepID=A0A6A3QYW7_9STRA|nr:hypothetical protein PF003_g15159 [Phytophthora fragariae]KAE8942865.1 hypothetical protein PF009_g7392 [Phytophthora fragariae]KAE8972513.1 hypothetical protein PF011_g25609 [Phytophthora fragariae]KAE9070503.1 hypothetical protein PF010_g26240 [Phytophthora fragariae]KAE9071821.1 hypothetical protein PF007_g26411 [Phytophthora fragariae]
MYLAVFTEDSSAQLQAATCTVLCFSALRSLAVATRRTFTSTGGAGLEAV